jgi:hypothetical protein
LRCPVHFAAIRGSIIGLAGEGIDVLRLRCFFTSSASCMSPSRRNISFLPAPNLVLPLQNFLDVCGVDIPRFVRPAGYLIYVIPEDAKQPVQLFHAVKLNMDNASVDDSG